MIDKIDDSVLLMDLYADVPDPSPRSALRRAVEKKAGYDPAERSERTKKAWLKRKRAAKESASVETADAEGDAEPVLRRATKADAPRLRALRVPPAWTDVEIADDPEQAMQARGRDAVGQLQYRYTAAHTHARAANKFARIAEFHRALPALRKRLIADLASEDAETRDVAAVTYTIDKTAFRPGSTAHRSGAAKAFGITTLQGRHVTVDGDKVTFNFIGKSGVRNRKTVIDAKLARIIRERKGEPRARLFQSNADDVNAYIKERAGDDFSAKDFRTWHGTAVAKLWVEKTPKPRNATQRKKAIKAVSERVAKYLGNTPTVARGSYIDPVVWDRWRDTK